MADVLLNVAAIRRRTRVNGPGLRAAVWVQGCTIGCRGCFNPATHAHAARALFDPEALADQLVEDGAVEGISISGGEPFEQAAACAALARRARERGASVVTYSGYTWRYLERARVEAVRELLAATDLLVAGPFVAGRPNDGRLWHGSSNQELVFLSDRYDATVVRARGADLPVVEVRADGGRLDITGVPGAEDLQALAQLAARVAAPR